MKTYRVKKGAFQGKDGNVYSAGDDVSADKINNIDDLIKKEILVENKGKKSTSTDEDKEAKRVEKLIVKIGKVNTTEALKKLLEGEKSDKAINAGEAKEAEFEKVRVDSVVKSINDMVTHEEIDEVLKGEESEDIIEAASEKKSEFEKVRVDNIVETISKLNSIEAIDLLLKDENSEDVKAAADLKKEELTNAKN